MSKENNTNTATTSTGKDVSPELHNPLTEAPVNEKTYTGTGAPKFTPEELVQDIPDFFPDIPAQTSEQPQNKINVPQPEPEGGSKKSQSDQQPKKEPYNPATSSMSDEEKENAAVKMAAAIMSGYKFLNNQAESLVKISRKKRFKLASSGRVDMSAEVPFENNTSLTLGEFFDEYNKQVDGCFEVDEKFEKAAMPPLIRILQKRGHGFSDEQYLLFLVGQDVFSKAMVGREIRSGLNQVIRFAEEQTTRMRQGAMPPPPPPPPQAAYASPHPEQERVVHMYPQHEMPIDEVASEEGLTLQEKAMNHVAKPKGEKAAMPKYGDKKKLKSLDRIAKRQEPTDAKKAVKKIIDNSKKRAAANPAIAVPTGKKGRGRPKGSKNRPKLP